jgi:hypothetical protein
MVFEIALVLLIAYELLALYHPKIPTITEILRGIPLFLSILGLLLLTFAVVDHIYFQWVVP